MHQSSATGVKPLEPSSSESAQQPASISSPQTATKPVQQAASKSLDQSPSKSSAQPPAVSPQKAASKPLPQTPTKPLPQTPTKPLPGTTSKAAQRRKKFGGWTVRDVADFVRGRTTDGGVWEYSGSLVALANGRVLSHVRGVEEVVAMNNGGVRRVVHDDSTSMSIPVLEGSPRRAPAKLTHAVRLVSRKALFYMDPKNGEPMDVFRYRPTAPPRRVFPVVTQPSANDLALDAEGHLVLTRARNPREDVLAAAAEPTSPSTPRITVRAPPMRPVRGVLSAAWTYVGRNTVTKSDLANKTPNKPGVVEDYHFMTGPGGGAVTWVRIGRCPSWYGGGQCMMNLRSVRVKGGRAGLDPEMRGMLESVKLKDPLKPGDVLKASRRPVPKPRRRKLFGIF